jgi:hypothetical protein
MLSGRLFNLRDAIRGALKLRTPVIYLFEGFVVPADCEPCPNYYAAFRRSTAFIDRILRAPSPPTCRSSSRLGST